MGFLGLLFFGPIVLMAAYFLALFKRPEEPVGPDQFEAARRAVGVQWWLVPVTVVTAGLAPILSGFFPISVDLGPAIPIGLFAIVVVPAALWMVGSIPVLGSQSAGSRWHLRAVAWLLFPFVVLVACGLTGVANCQLLDDMGPSELICMNPDNSGSGAPLLLPTLGDLANIAAPLALILATKFLSAPSRWRHRVAEHLAGFVVSAGAATWLMDVQSVFDILLDESEVSRDFSPYPEWAQYAFQGGVALLMLVSVWHLSRVLIPPRLVVPVTPAPH